MTTSSSASAIKQQATGAAVTGLPTSSDINAEKEMLRRKLREMEAAVRKTDRAADIARVKDNAGATPSGVRSSGGLVTRSHSDERSSSSSVRVQPPPPVAPKPKRVARVFGDTDVDRQNKLETVLGRDLPADVKRQRQRMREELHILTATRRLKLDEQAEISRAVFELVHSRDMAREDAALRSRFVTNMLLTDQRLLQQHEYQQQQLLQVGGTGMYGGGSQQQQQRFYGGSPGMPRKPTSADRRKQQVAEELNDVELEFRRRYPSHLFPSYYDGNSLANDFVNQAQATPPLDTRSSSRGLSASQSDTDLPIMHSPWRAFSTSPRMRCYSSDDEVMFPPDISSGRSYLLDTETPVRGQQYQKGYMDGTTLEISEHFFTAIDDRLGLPVSRDVSNDELLLSMSPSVSSTLGSGAAFIRPIDCYDDVTMGTASGLPLATSRSPRFYLTAENLKDLAVTSSGAPSIAGSVGAPTTGGLLSSSPDVYSSSEYMAHKIGFSLPKDPSIVDLGQYQLAGNVYFFL
jgi:hypothetical protein